MKSCKNNQIIDPAEGAIISEADAYVSQPAEVVDTGDAVLSGPGILQPVSSCDTPTPTPCCRELTFYNWIKPMTIGGTGFGSLELVANLSCSDPGANLSVDWGDGTPVEPVTPLVMLPHDVSGLADGIYVGTVTSHAPGGNATMDFVYEVNGGLATNIQYFHQLSITTDLTCSLYPDYLINVTDESMADSAMFSNYEALIGATVAHTEAPDPVNFSSTFALTHDFAADTVVLTFKMTTNLGVDSSATAVLTAECIA